LKLAEGFFKISGIQSQTGDIWADPELRILKFVGWQGGEMIVCIYVYASMPQI